MAYYVYILECADDTLYTGITTDLSRRLEEHRHGVGAKYTRTHGARSFVYTQICKNRSDAQKREYEIKRLSASEKRALCK